MTFENNRSIGVKLKCVMAIMVLCLINGCSLSFDQMLPTLTGEDPIGDSSTADKESTITPPSDVPVLVAKSLKPSQPPILGTSKFEPKILQQDKIPELSLGRRQQN